MTAILFLQSPISYARAARSLNLQSGADAMAYEWLRLGVRAAVEGNREDARYYFVQAVRTDLNLGRAWLYLGGVADDAALTLSCMQKVLQLEPNEPQAWNGLIWAREKLGLLQLPLPLVPPMTGTTPTRSLGAPATAVLPTDEGTAGPPASGHRTSVLGPDDAGRPHRPVTQPLDGSRLGRTPITSTLSPNDLTAGPSTAGLHTSALAEAAATPEIIYRPDTMMRTGTLEQAGRLARRQTGPLEEPPPPIGTYYPASTSTTSTLAEPAARLAVPQTMPLFPATVDAPAAPAEPVAAAPQTAEAQPVAALQTAPLETEEEPGVLASLAALFAPLPVIEAPPEEPNEIAFAPASGVAAAAAPEVAPAEATPLVAEALAPAVDTLPAPPAEITFAPVVEAAPEPPAAPIAAAPAVEVAAPVAVTFAPAAPVAPPTRARRRSRPSRRSWPPSPRKSLPGRCRRARAARTRSSHWSARDCCATAWTRRPSAIVVAPATSSSRRSPPTATTCKPGSTTAASHRMPRRPWPAWSGYCVRSRAIRRR